ncbi:Carboxymuconolactone decarboxylase family protein [compost metagenome]
MNSINYGKLSERPTKALYALEMAIKESSSIDPVLMDLVKIRASQINGCMLCIDMHIKEARIHGERELRLHHLVAFHESPLFTEKEKAALTWAEQVTKVQNGVPEEYLKKVLEHFSEKEVSDLTFTIATINLWNRFGVSFHGVPGSMDKFLGLDKAGLT